MDDTIPGLLGTAAEQYGERSWLRVDGGELSFAAAAREVARVASRLREEGVEPGDRVLFTAYSTPPYLLLWLATCSIGAIAVPVNPASATAELASLVAQVRPRLSVTDGDIARFAGDWQDDSAGGEWALEAKVEPADVAVLIPTSGTTGRSKLVMQTHRAYAYAGVGFPWWMELGPDDRLMTSLPLFHINAPAYSVMGSLACGAGLVLLPRFSAHDFLAAARRHGATEFNAIGAMLEILMRQPERPDDADTPLRLCYTGPSPAKAWQEAFERRFGLRVVCGYAMSESPYGLIWAHGTRPFGTLGSVRQHPTLGTINEARVVDDDGHDVGIGAAGELLLRNPVVTPGYWEMPEETSAAIVDGWLHTGDLVTVEPDGLFTFVSRKKEVIRRRGENLSPAEVEEAIASHPDVVECAVVGVPSELSEEDVKAFVVMAPGAAPDFEQLRDWAAQRLTAFKVPRYWQAVGELPRTPTARIAKHRLPAGHPAGEYDAEAPGRSWRPPWVVAAFLLFSVALVPWIVWLAVSLPSRHTDHFYDVTWVGFDIGLLGAMASVAWLAHRRSANLELAATVAGTMLVIDAWFDITTSTPGADRWEAIAAAVLFELPIAGLCGWLARNGDAVRRRRAPGASHRVESGD
ncbi:MAG TPA: AMP-binding protein [Mycobacteriales bacterium]|nr:AMP-binding protein [Mycobacteriales bacterium]